MTNKEFQTKFNAMFTKHPMLARSNPKSLNEIVYVLRIEGDQDYCINTTNGECIPSVRETFIPSHWLSKKVISIDWEEYENGCGIIVVDLK